MTFMMPCSHLIVPKVQQRKPHIAQGTACFAVLYSQRPQLLCLFILQHPVQANHSFFVSICVCMCACFHVGGCDCGCLCMRRPEVYVCMYVEGYIYVNACACEGPRGGVSYQPPSLIHLKHEAGTPNLTQTCQNGWSQMADSLED